jgi:peptide/nickel transport system permease protein
LPDFAVRAATVRATAVAVFWLAIILQLLFAMTLHWLPLRGRLGDDVVPPAAITRFYLADSLLTLRFDAFASESQCLSLNGSRCDTVAVSKPVTPYAGCASQLCPQADG